VWTTLDLRSYRAGCPRLPQGRKQAQQSILQTVGSSPHPAVYRAGRLRRCTTQQRCACGCSGAASASHSVCLIVRASQDHYRCRVDLETSSATPVSEHAILMSPCRSVACCSPGAASRPEEASRTSQGSRWTITTPATASAALPPARSLQVGSLRCKAALQISNLAMTATVQACLLHLFMGNLTSCTVWRAYDQSSQSLEKRLQALIGVKDQCISRILSVFGDAYLTEHEASRCTSPCT